MLKVALFERGNESILRVPAGPAPDLLDRVLVDPIAQPALDRLFKRGEDDALDVQVQAHAYRVGRHQELHVAQPVVKHERLVLLGFRRQSSVDYRAVVVFFRVCCGFFVERFVDSFFNLKKSLPGEGNYAVAWSKIRKFIDTLVLHM